MPLRRCSRRLPTHPEGVRVAAVGQATAQVLRQRGWRVDLVPDQAEAGALVSALAPELQAGTRVLYPASSRALPTIAKGLAQLGAEVTQVEAYRTEPAAPRRQRSAAHGSIATGSAR